jgi:hypothetical protein
MTVAVQAHVGSCLGSVASDAWLLKDVVDRDRRNAIPIKLSHLAILPEQ